MTKNAYERMSDATPGLSKWRVPCPDAFVFLAKNYPEKLLELISSSSLSAVDLTFAAEMAGRHGWSEETKQVLFGLLTVSDPFVQEGVIYGLSEHLDDSEVRERLEHFATNDKTLREVLSDVLS